MFTFRSRFDSDLMQNGVVQGRVPTPVVAVLGFFALCTAAASISAQDGYVDVTGNATLRVQVLTSSLRRDSKNHNLIWADVRYHARASQSGFRTTTGTTAPIVDARVRVDCSARTAFEVDSFFRTKDGQTLDEIHRPVAMPAPLPVPSGSINSVTVKWICANAPAEAKGSLLDSAPRETHVAMSGSAFAVSTAGKLLTNNHVVDGCSEVTVTDPDGQVVTGRIEARDSRNDLALLAIPSVLSTVATFRSTPIRAGEDVVAVGFPLRGLLAMGLNV